MNLQLKQKWNFDSYQGFIREFKLEKWFKNTFEEDYLEFERIDIGDDEIIEKALEETGLFKDRKMFSIYNDVTDSFDVYEFENC